MGTNEKERFILVQQMKRSVNLYYSCSCGKQSNDLKEDAFMPDPHGRSV